MTVDILKNKHKDILYSKNFEALKDNQLNNMAILMENQTQDYKKLLTENSASGDVAQFIPLLIPIVRRTFPKLIANHIAGVQAMTAPQGALFAMTARYTGEGTDTGDVSNAKGQIVVFKENTENKVVVGKEAIQDTTNKAVIKYIEDGGKVALVNFTEGAPLKAGKITVDGKELEAVAVYSNEAHFHKVLKNYAGPLDVADGEAEGDTMKTLSLLVEKVDAKAKTRNLKGQYTIEMANDLKAMHGADAEKEIMEILSKEVQVEIDREVISKINGSATTLPDIDIAASSGRWDIEKFRNLSLRIANEAREIGRLTRRGSGNVLLVSPKVATALEQVGNFILSPSKGNIDAAGSGLNPVLGMFDNKFKVVVDNFCDNEYFTVLYKGSDKDAGVFFAPYVGLTFVRVVDPASGQPSIILKTRYDVVNNPLTPEAYSRTANINFNGVF